MKQMSILDTIATVETAKRRAKSAGEAAAGKAEKVWPGWKLDALEAVRQFASSHADFLAEEIVRGHPLPPECDPRAWGAIIRRAKDLGWIRMENYCRTGQLNRSPKPVWKSLIYGGSS